MVSHDDSTRERAVLVFLEQLIQDREHGRVHAVEHYLDRFPSIADRIREEYSSLVEGPRGEIDRLGAYRLLRVIGEGGQGIVYEALDERMNRRVALKVLPRALAASDGKMPAAVARELEALARLDHPGVCVVYDAGAADGHAYLAMRLVRGAPLSESIGRLSVEEAARCIERVAVALHAAHLSGVIHRDIKPANILLDEDGAPVLVDFGLARATKGDLPTLTRTGDLLGTPHYLSPERLRGEGQRDPRGDVWALGVTLYELLAGQRPFAGHSVEAVARAVEQQEPQALHLLSRSIPRDLAVIVQTALSKELHRRYQSAEELAKELERWRLGQPIHARPVSLVGRTSRWVRRNPAPSAVLALLVAGVGASAWTAGAFRDLAGQRTQAWAESQASLSSSRLEQARMLSMSRQPGRSWQMERRVAEAAEARVKAVELGAAESDLPPMHELRSLALDASILPDSRVVQQVDHEGYALGALSADGRWLATRSILPTATGLVTQELRLHDMMSGELLASSQHEDLLDRQEGIAVSPDGRWIAVPSPDETTLDLWDLRGEERVHRLPMPIEIQLGAEERQIEQHLRLWKIEFSADGSKVALSVAPRESRVTLPSPRGFAVWEIESGAMLLGARAGTTRYPWLSFSADSSQIVVQPEPTVAEVFDLANAAADRSARSVARIDFGMLVKAAVIPADGSSDLIVVAGHEAGGAEILARVDQASGSLRWRQVLEEKYEWAHAPGLCLDPDGKRMLMAFESGALQLIDPLSGQVMMQMAGTHEARIESLRWRPSGAGWASHGRAGRSKRWQLKMSPSFVEEIEVPHDGADRGMFASDFAGQTFAYIHPERSETIEVWEAESGDRGPWMLEAERRADSVYQLLFHPGGEEFYEIGTTLCTAWDLETGIVSHREPTAGAEFIHGGFDSRFDLWVVERAEDKYALVRFADGERRPLPALPASGWVDRSDRGGWLLAIPADHDRSLPTLARVQEDGSYEPVTSSWPGMPEQAELHRRNARISEDGRYVALLIRLEEYELLVWDQSDKRLVAQLAVGGDPEWESFDFDSSGSQFAFGTEDGRVHLLDLPSGREWASWQAHHSEVRVLRFVGGQDKLLSWAGKESARLWDGAAMRSAQVGNSGK